MGRPRVSDEQRVVTGIRLPESLHRRLHATATERDVSANLLVTRAVEAFLDQLPDLEDVLSAPGTSSTERSAK